MTQTVRRVAIIGGNRIPFARSNSAYSYASNQDMLTAALNGLVNRYNLQGEHIGEFIAGAVIKHSRDFNLARETLLSTALSPRTVGCDLQQACGTGLQAIMMAANKIALGQIDSAIAGGSDTTSDAPIAVSEGLRKILLETNRQKTTKDKIKTLMKIRPKHLAPLVPRNGEPRTGMSMGEHTELTVKAWGITREEQDQIAFNSHENLLAAYDRGFFDDLVTPFQGVEKDNLARTPNMEKLASLKPAFDKKSGNGTLTAGNSSALTDGASVVLLASEEWAKAHNLPVKAYLSFYETAAVDFFGKDGNKDKEGLLLAPAYAVPAMLKRAGITLQDFDFYEIHEAFAGVVCSTLKAWEDEKFCKEKLGLDAPLGSIDRSKLNVNGSSIATGHPFAATGGRIVASLAKMLEEKGSGRGLISICAAGGQGVVAIIER
ncbi:acetyl-CoA C-acetyltransferase [Thalassolituus sp.]|jgi:acetyl-CoA C-acetyltransferase|uniref:acetyl-CoA C-acetyltransferase n=1 Tax=Thalassolituus sp. TaxID=2030822 RepID=UPI002A825E2E|nr:acetyl-CoA C-acetyltransferase [Thalassolituus sp.]